MKFKTILMCASFAPLLTGCVDESNIGSGRTFPVQFRVDATNPTDIGTNTTATVYIFTENWWAENGAGMDESARRKILQQHPGTIVSIGQTNTVNNALQYRSVAIVDYKDKLTVVDNISPPDGTLVSVKVQ